MTDFTVIIPTYKDWDRLTLCVESVLNQEIEGLSFEIIVVDNEPEHHPPENLLQHPKINLIHEPSPGSYAARNSGAKIAKGIYLAFTDADCLTDNRWLKNAQKKFINSNCDLEGGRIDIFKPDGGGKWAYIYEKYTAFAQEKNVPKGHSVTANLFVKRDVFEALGGFNDKIKSGGDWEFSKRAVDAGYRLVYADEVRVHHPARKSMGAIFKKQKRFAAWGYLNVKNKYGHSGFRIIGSRLLHGTPSVFKTMKYPDLVNEKLIVLLISLQIHVYKMALQALFLFNIMDPNKIRE